jgi:hypothetical protein
VCGKDYSPPYLKAETQLGPIYESAVDFAWHTFMHQKMEAELEKKWKAPQ